VPDAAVGRQIVALFISTLPLSDTDYQGIQNNKFVILPLADGNNPQK
jgi:hypothetical protein